MNRRNFIIAHSALLAGVAQADTPKVQSLDEALRWLDRLDKAASVKSATQVSSIGLSDCDDFNSV